MHYIQKQILGLLMTRQSARYSQLRPEGVESNLFSYHLRALMRDGYIVKQSQGEYILTPKGKLYCDQLGSPMSAPRIQAKIITLLAIREPGGGYLLYRRNRQPFIGYVGFPYGKVQLGEKIADAAHRGLGEKTGLDCALEHIGDGYITSYESDRLVSQVLFHLFAGEVGERFLLPEGQSWGVPLHLPAAEILPGVMEIYTKLRQQDKKFFIEVEKRL